MERTTYLIAVVIAGCSGQPFSGFDRSDAGVHEGGGAEATAGRPASSAGGHGDSYAPDGAAGVAGAGASSARGGASGTSGGSGPVPPTAAGSGGTGGADDGAAGTSTAGAAGQPARRDAGPDGSSGSDGGLDLHGCYRLETTGPCNSHGWDNLYQCPLGESPQNFMRVLCTLQGDDPGWRCCSDNIEGGQLCKSLHDCDVTCEIELPCCNTAVARCGCGGGKTCEPKL